MSDGSLSHVERHRSGDADHDLHADRRSVHVGRNIGVIFRRLPVPAMPTCGVLWIEGPFKGPFFLEALSAPWRMWISCSQGLG